MADEVLYSLNNSSDNTVSVVIPLTTKSPNNKLKRLDPSTLSTKPNSVEMRSYEAAPTKSKD